MKSKISFASGSGNFNAFSYIFCAVAAIIKILMLCVFDSELLNTIISLPDVVCNQKG
jgi:hypothetical protein